MEEMEEETLRKKKIGNQLGKVKEKYKKRSSENDKEFCKEESWKRNF